MNRTVICAVAVIVLMVSVSGGGEIGFVEDFALAKDRSVPLKQLIPGTEDYYYYHCLHLQNRGERDEVDNMLELWIKRYGRTERVIEIENRRALLRYDKKPQESLALIRQRLGLTSLKYQKLEHLVEAIGLPKDQLCTYCWDGADNRPS